MQLSNVNLKRMTYTLWVKKTGPFHLSITLSNTVRF